MSFKGFAGKFVDDATRNPNVGNLAYILHRITGIGLAVYLIMHTWVLSSAQSGPSAFTDRLGVVQSPLFYFLELFLVVALFFHMLNGIRIIVADFFSATRQHKLLFWIVATLFVVLIAWNVAVVVPRIFAR
jgi:succinate dehydrogenase / fumarate reductase cytochrome b subunit